MDVADRG